MKKYSKKLLCLCLAVIMCFTLVGCSESSDTAKKEKEYTEKAMNNAIDSVSLPNISNYFERSQLKTIYELRDDPNLICYWYTKSQMTGKWVFEGKCMGYGIPYSASMTSPDRLERLRDGSSIGGTISQAEPNGIYTNGLSTSATWVLTLNNKGEVTPTYVEQEICIRQKSNKINKNMCESWSIPENY